MFYSWLFVADYQQNVGSPITLDKEDRECLFKIYTQATAGYSLADNLDFKKIAETTEGYSGRDIQEVCNKALEISKGKNKDSIDMGDLEEALAYKNKEEND